MTYTPREIKDRVAVGDDIFIVEDLGNNRIRLIPAPIQVLEPGTPINKTLLQPIEDYLATIDCTITADKVFAAILQAGGIDAEYIKAINADISTITASDGLMTMDEEGIVVSLSDDGYIRLSPDGGLVYGRNGIRSGYLRSAKVGTAKDGDYVELNFLSPPKIAPISTRIPTFIEEYNLYAPENLQVQTREYYDGFDSRLNVAVTAVTGNKESDPVWSEIYYDDPYEAYLSWDRVAGAEKYRVYVEEGTYKYKEVTATNSGWFSSLADYEWQSGAPPRTNMSGYAPQALRVEAINPTADGFGVMARLVRLGASEGADITGVSLAKDEYYETAYLDPTYQSMSQYQIEGTSYGVIVNDVMKPGSCDYRFDLKLEGMKSGGVWQDLANIRVTGHSTNNPLFANQPVAIGVNWKVLTGVDVGNWKFRLTLVDRVLLNPRWYWGSEGFHVYPKRHEWNSDKVLATGTVNYIALDGGDESV